jgi:hypothetical protein
MLRFFLFIAFIFSHACFGTTIVNQVLVPETAVLIKVGFKCKYYVESDDVNIIVEFPEVLNKTFMFQSLKVIVSNSGEEIFSIKPEVNNRFLVFNSKRDVNVKVQFTYAINWKMKKTISIEDINNNGFCQ